jgi:cysteine-rich repeat protein
VAVIVSAFLLGAIPASAHQNPANCTGNNLGLDVAKNKTQIVNGETVHYLVQVRNDAPGACDIDNGTVTFTCPAADGTATGAATVCVAGASYPAGFPQTTTCAVDCVVTVNPGVVSAQVSAEVHGTLHDNPVNDLDTADLLKFISVLLVSCGDGVIDVPGETCEPPNSPAGSSGNLCRDDCTVCGDGIVDPGETCDDGNNNDSDGCPNRCFPHECGDGIVDAGEACDDGNTNNTDACRNNCTIPRCGDGIVDSGEACDDGNTNNTDACRNDCTLPVCGDGVVDAGEECDDGNGVAGDGCENDCTPTLIEAICRTPGFWGTHAGTEKGHHSQNITEAVIDCADGNCADHTANDFLLICGEKIDSPDSNPADGTTDWNDASSSTEALCVPVKGAQILQLARQLTAGALNCIMSNGDESCASTPLYATVFASCNAACSNPASTKAQLTACISELDCLNNGGTFNGGICSPGGPNNCHERLLNNDDLDLHFEPPGPAGSSDACHAANDTNCTVVGPGEAQCGTDTLP